MLTHLSDIGFQIEEEDDLTNLVDALSRTCKPILVRAGFYKCAQIDERTELWMQFSRQNTWLGLNPHFNGKSHYKLRLTATVFRSDDQLDGAFYAWADPDRQANHVANHGTTDNDTAPGLFPFVFDLPDFHTLPGLQLPQVAEVQLAAFALSMTCFEELQQFYTATEANGDDLAALSFQAIGLHTDDGEDEEEPEALARISGKILEVAFVTNPHTGNAFHWLLVETLAGTIDVVCDPELLDCDPDVGGYILGDFWLSGKLASPLEVSDYEFITTN